MYPETAQGKRIWATTCGRRRAREDVHIGKWKGMASHPLIQQNCMWVIIQKGNLENKNLKAEAENEAVASGNIHTEINMGIG